MKRHSHILRNIGTLLTLDSSTGEGPLGEIRDAALVIEEGKVAWVGPERTLPVEFKASEEKDVQGALVTPGLIDCHTHAIFAGSRSDEFFARLRGESYEEIARKGGGIARTVAATREATDETLLSNLGKALDSFRSFGVTTVEVKSGYGLSTAQELRLLRLAGKMKHEVDIIPTFLGAHIVPPERKGDRSHYVREICEEMLPAVQKEKLSKICDVFCDEGAFSIDETRQVLAAAKKLGFKLKVHAEQLKGTGAAELAAEVGALSAEHLEHVTDAGIAALAQSGTVAVLLPGALFSMGKRNYPPARKLLERGVAVALSTDFNPGTSATTNLPLMMSLAAVEMKMTVEEIWKGVTLHAAKALGLSDRGRLAEGFRADVAIWDAERPEEIPYKLTCVPWPSSLHPVA